MRPTPIPDDWAASGRRVVVAAPSGDLMDPDVAAVEVLVIDGAEAGGIYIRIALDPGDLEALAAGMPIWLCLRQQFLPVFSVGVEGQRS